MDAGLPLPLGDHVSSIRLTLGNRRCQSGRVSGSPREHVRRPNNAVAVVEDALSLTGNHGLTRANPLERHYRDVLRGRVHTPQDDATRINAGRLALGI